MSDPMAEIKASFFLECEDLLESLFDALQQMSGGADDSETINVAFRAVHSIKGGAGAFSLDDLVSFAHHFETAMDDVRSGKLSITPDLSELFFRCGDMLSDLVRAARDDDAADAVAVSAIVADLVALTGADEDPGSGEVDLGDFAAATLNLADLDAEPAGDGDVEATLEALLAGGPPGELPPLDLDVEVTEEEADAPSGPRTFKIVFKPEPEMYDAGNEPLFLLRSLEALGTCTTTVAQVTSEGFPSTMSGAGLTWTILIETDVEKDSLGDVFEFAENLCTLTITEVGDDAAVPEARPPAPTAEVAPLPVEDTDPESPNIPPGGGPVSPSPAAAQATDTPATRPAAKVTAAPQTTVRVDLARVDRLVNLVGELVINQAMLSQSVAEAKLGGATNVTAGLEEFLQLTRDIQDSVMMIRAQPVKSLFQRMARIVREASSAIGKTVVLKTGGEGTEIDKTVIERLADPLTHMIRNAVDHGLEKPEVRSAAGKPEQGVVTLTAAHKSGRVTIEVADDGAGINRPRVKQIAIDKGLITADAQLSDGEIDNLLFLPGFSTAKEISNLSGRGVGMDVVKSAITNLGGRVSITSVEGVGTTFTISLPLTLAVLDGMVIRVEKETLVVPLNTIKETLTIQPGMIEPLGRETNLLLVRETLVPIFDLGVELGYRDPRDSYENAIALLITQEDDSLAALVIDKIEDQRQVVIKGLEESFGSVPGVAAATILGNGRIALILDTTDLIASASGRTRSGTELKRAS